MRLLMGGNDTQVGGCGFDNRRSPPYIRRSPGNISQLCQLTIALLVSSAGFNGFTRSKLDSGHEAATSRKSQDIQRLGYRRDTFHQGFSVAEDPLGGIDDPYSRVIGPNRPAWIIYRTRCHRM